MRRLTLLALLLAAAPVVAYDFPCPTRFGTGGSDYEDGLVKANWSLEYLEDGVVTADPGITVTQIGSDGTYTIAGLPDHAAATDPLRTLIAVSPGGTICAAQWPGSPPRVGQVVEWRPTYSLDSGRTIAVGDAAVDIALTVSGLSADPTGSVVEFSMWCRGTLVVDGAAGSIVGGSVTEATDGTWQAQLLFDTQPADVATAAKDCIAKFQLDPGGSNQITLPPGNTLKIDILEFTP